MISYIDHCVVQRKLTRGRKSQKIRWKHSSIVAIHLCSPERCTRAKHAARRAHFEARICGVRNGKKRSQTGKPNAASISQMILHIPKWSYIYQNDPKGVHSAATTPCLEFKFTPTKNENKYKRLLPATVAHTISYNHELRCGYSYWDSDEKSCFLPQTVFIGSSVQNFERFRARC